jgi:hypothetical protein
MIPSIIERLVLQGDAQIIQQTVGLSGAMTIEVPPGKTIVITSVNLQPLLGLADISTDFSTTIFADYADFVQKALTQWFNISGVPVQEDCLNILELILSRGITQLELYSIDNRTVFTYTNEYTPVLTTANTSFEDPTGVNNFVTWLPTIKEHKDDCYSVHKNQVHIRLRFTNQFFFDPAGGQIISECNRYTDLISNGDLRNTVPEQANNVNDINKDHLFFNIANYLNAAGQKLGNFPFANETELNGSLNLGQYQNNKFFVLPYLNEFNDKPNGKNGELGYFIDGAAFGQITNLKPYQQLFTPYINIQYALINEQPSSLQIVSPDKYQTVIPKS